MIDKRYQVFVSSTFTDLIVERQKIKQALLELDCIPAGMELFPAANSDQWTLIKKVIDDCDYYLVIIAGKYGSIGPDGISYTEMEYRYALQQGKPIIAFLHKNVGSIAADKVDSYEEIKEKLDKFKELAKQKLVRFWDNPAELGSVASRSLIQLIKNNPAIGWVRGDNVTDESSAQEILRLRKFIDKLQAERIVEAEIARDRTTELAQGDDVINLQCTVTYKKASEPFYKQTGWKADITWNAVFAAVAPSMLDEASEATLKSRLDDALFMDEYDDIMSDTSIQVTEIRNLKIDQEPFETCVVQLVAPRLIAKSVRGRSVKDKQTYWRLTELGEALMYKLRAISRNDDKRA